MKDLSNKKERYSNRNMRDSQATKKRETQVEIGEVETNQRETKMEK